MYVSPPVSETLPPGPAGSGAKPRVDISRSFNWVLIHSYWLPHIMTMAALPAPSDTPLSPQLRVSCGRTSSVQRSCLRKLSASTGAPVPKPAVYLALPADAMRSVGLAPNVYETMVRCHPAAVVPSLMDEKAEVPL